MIREANPEDAAKIVRLAGKFLATSSFGRLFAFDQRRLEELVYTVLDMGTIFIAEATVGTATDSDGNILALVEMIGFLAVVEAVEPFSGQRYADEIAWFVDPDHRGGTAAVRLLHSLEKWTLDNSLSFVKMVAPIDGNSDVAGFLTRNGYQALEASYVKRF